tara:strand:+ start:3348 stop:3602 length:255 start_codon:yes stop_codon:yes gene_type:complete
MSKEAEAKKTEEEAKKKEAAKFKKGDVVNNASPVDLNAINFANRNVVKWKEMSSGKQPRATAPVIAGLKTLGSGMKGMRLKGRK